MHIEISNTDREHFVRQAHREGMTLSAWLHAAACERLENRQHAKPFVFVEDAMAFFRACDALDGPIYPAERQNFLTIKVLWPKR